MGKLFEDDATDVLEVGGFTRYNEPTEAVDFSSLAEAEDSISLVTENFAVVASRVDDVNGMLLNYKDKTVGSQDYFATMEAYSPILENIASNLGLKHRIPSMEDFTNAYGTQAAHQIALEGIGEFLKSLWAKLRDLLKRFFKKVNEFFRRLIKANLEIDTYDKYIPGLIKDIKVKKLVCDDPEAKVKSKLPALLANPGMSSMDEVFLINTGLPRLENLSMLIGTKIIPSLHSFCASRLPELKAALMKINELQFTGDEASIETMLESYKINIEKAVEGIVQGFCDNVTEANELSDKAYEVLSDSLATSRVSELNIYSLVDGKNTFARLPKNFNVYMAINTNKDKVFAVASSEEEHTIDELRAATEVGGLLRLNDFYQQYKKGFNIKALDTACKGLEDSVEDFTKFMYGTFNSKVKELETKGSGAKKREEMVGIAASALKQFPDILLAASETSSYLEKIPGLILYIEMWRATNEIDLQELAEIIDRSNDTVVNGLYLGTIKALSDRGIMFDNSNVVVDEKVTRRVTKTTADLEKFIMSMLQTLQVVHRGLATSTMSLYTETRYELAKYIYDSARLYK